MYWLSFYSKRKRIKELEAENNRINLELERQIKNIEEVDLQLRQMSDGLNMLSVQLRMMCVKIGMPK